MNDLITSQIDTAASLAYGVIPGAPLTAWEMKFIDDLAQRVKRFGDKTFISEKQAQIVARIAAKAA